jgi:hypothetical protein
VSDWLKHDAVGARLFGPKAASEWQPDDDKTDRGRNSGTGAARRARGLSPLDYAKRRKRAATRLGISVGATRSLR